MKRLVLILMLGAVAVVAQPQHDHQFTFPEKFWIFSSRKQQLLISSMSTEGTRCIT